jgi:hypothetical protein
MSTASIQLKNVVASIRHVLTFMVYTKNIILVNFWMPGLGEQKSVNHGIATCRDGGFLLCRHKFFILCKFLELSIKESLSLAVPRSQCRKMKGYVALLPFYLC